MAALEAELALETALLSEDTLELTELDFTLELELLELVLELELDDGLCTGSSTNSSSAFSYTTAGNAARIFPVLFGVLPSHTDPSGSTCISPLLLRNHFSFLPSLFR